MNGIRDILGFAARTGLPMGLYLTLIAGCFFGSLYIDFLSITSLLLFGGLPVLLYYLLKPLTTGEKPAKAAALWLAGIYCFLFGALIAGLASAIFLIFIEPGFMTMYLRQYLDTVDALPDPSIVAEQRAMVEQIIERKMVPTAMETVSSIIWTIGFFGSILSGIMALFMSRMSRRKTGSRVVE